MEAPSFEKLAQDGVVGSLPCNTAHPATKLRRWRRLLLWPECKNMGNGFQSFKRSSRRRGNPKQDSRMPKGTATLLNNKRLQQVYKTPNVKS